MLFSSSRLSALIYVRRAALVTSEKFSDGSFQLNLKFQARTHFKVQRCFSMSAGCLPAGLKTYTHMMPHSERACQCIRQDVEKVWMKKLLSRPPPEVRPMGAPLWNHQPMRREAECWHMRPGLRQVGS